MRKSVFRRNPPQEPGGAESSSSSTGDTAETNSLKTGDAVSGAGAGDSENQMSQGISPEGQSTESGEESRTDSESQPSTNGGHDGMNQGRDISMNGESGDPGDDAQTPFTLPPVDPAHVVALEREVKENYDKYLRAMAELENFKKRALKDRSDLIRYAGENLARDLLEIADNFEIAFGQDLSALPPDFVQGFRLIYERFTGILARYEVKPESALGTMFDPAKQQALASVPTSDHAPGTIIEEFKRSYFFKDKLLRPGQVIVAVAPPDLPVVPPPSESEESGDVERDEDLDSDEDGKES